MAGGARNYLTRPKGGQRLRPSTMKPAEDAVGRLEAGLDRQKLLLKRPVGIRRDLNPSLPPGLAMSFDCLVGSDRIARKVLFTKKKETEQVRR